MRWALFRFAARAAGKDALPAMANMAITDPRFQGDYHDFERLYASGIVDFDRVWFGLPVAGSPRLPRPPRTEARTPP